MKVTYKDWSITQTEVLYFKKFRQNGYHEVFGIFNVTKKDGSIGTKVRQIFSGYITDIEPITE